MNKPAAINLTTYGRLLRENVDFRRLWLAQVISETGDWLYTVALYSLLLEITGNTRTVAFAIVLQMMPQVLVSPLAGVINDRCSRRTVMIVSDIARFFIIGSLLFVRGPRDLWLIYTALFLETVMWAFFEPGRNAMIPNITRNRDELTVANAFSSATWAFNFFFGGALGGFMAAHFGRQVVFGVDAVTFLVSAWLISRMHVTETHFDGLPALRWRDLFDFKPVMEGIRYIRASGQRTSLLLVKGSIGLLGANWIILPVFGERVFPLAFAGYQGAEAGMLGMSALMSARGLGSMIGSYFGTQWAGGVVSRMCKGIFFAFACVAVGYVGLGGAPNLVVAFAFVALGHAGGSLNWVFSTTMLQLMTEDRFRGRVSSAEYALLLTGISVTSWIAGVAMDMGAPIRHVAAATGLIAALPCIYWFHAQRKFRDGAGQ